jgi:hypothetical protein
VSTHTVQTVAVARTHFECSVPSYIYNSAIVSSIISDTKRTVQYKFTPSAVVTYIDLYSFNLIVRRY